MAEEMAGEAQIEPEVEVEGEAQKQEVEEQVEGGEVEGEVAPEPDEWDAELSPAMQEYWGGAKTHREAAQRYAGASREAQRLADLNRGYERTLQLVQEELQHRRAEQAPKEEEVGPYYGFRSPEEAQHLRENAPYEYQRRYQAWQRKQTHDAVREVVGDIPERLKAHEQERLAEKQRECDVRSRKYFKQALEDRPEFKEGGPGAAALKEVFARPGAVQYFQAMLWHHPDQDPWAPFFDMAEAQLARKKLQAQEARLNDKRGKAGVARTKVAGKTAQSYDLSTEVGRQQKVIDDWKAAGHALSKEMEEASLASARRRDQGFVS